MALGSDGTVFVGARDNRLYALKDNIRPFVQAPADRLSGDLVRDPSTGKVYVIVDGQRRYIPDPGTQLLLGLAGPLPTNLNASELARFPEGPALPSLGEGSVLRSSNGVVYAIRNGQRAWIHNLDEFAAGNYRWEAVVAVEDRIVRTIPLALESGMLLRGAGDRVYLYDGSQRQWITTADAFAARGYTWSQVHFVSDATLQAIPEGAQLS